MDNLDTFEEFLSLPIDKTAYIMVTKDSTHLRNNKIMYYTPQSDPMGMDNGQTNKQTNFYSIFRDKLSLPDGSLDYKTAIHLNASPYGNPLQTCYRISS
jgi:hypothetical protein